MDIVEVKNLSKRYDNFRLENVSFRLQTGKITGFIGRNGAGKTTTIKSMLGFLSYEQGDIFFFQKDYKDNEIEIKQEIGYVSGGFHFYSNKKLKDITKVTKSFYKNWQEDLYQTYLKKFNLEEKKTPAQLSEGMKVKYSIALALSHKAKILILDEPTSGLDPISRDELLDVFLELEKEGVTIFFSTHITSDLEKCADHIIFIQKGKIKFDGTRKELVESYSYVEIKEEELRMYNKDLILGIKKNKTTYVGIILKKNHGLFSKVAKEADIEKIMIHLEKEIEDETAYE